MIPPDYNVRRCTVTGVAWTTDNQTFFSAELDTPIRFGDLGEYDRIVVYSRGPDFMRQYGDSIVFLKERRGIALGYIGIDDSLASNDRPRFATIECEFSENEKLLW